ncbi:MAG TPA: flagellar hook-associated protein FlgK [Steroidobacteraceae bacterium]|nr:flagellar hook-associated protein FlgK [Steroidobacteraceae bacterium]
MANILSTGVSGLLAFQRALDVTSHNIANSSTPGFSRQGVQLGTRDAERLGSGYVGTGVNVQTISRSYDDLLATQMRSATSSSSRLDAYATKAQVLNNLFADSSTGLSASLQRFASAVQGVSNEPTSTAARQVMLSEAQGLTQRLQTYNSRLDEINTEINSRLTSETATISSIADSIAKLNQQIVSAQTSGQAPNDLLDERDRQINALSEHMNVTVVKQDDGAWNVFVGNGQSLVLGNTAAKIVAQRDAYDPNRMTVAYQAGSSTTDMSTTISGGTLGGLMDFRREMLDPVRNQLGQIAVGLASAMNAQHHEGMDLLGNLGGDLFGVGAVGVLPKSSNTGTGTVAVTRTNAGALTSGDYILEFSAGAWSARRSDTGAAVPLSGAGTVASPFTADGLSIVVGGTPANGDRFLVRPTAGAVAGMSVLVTDPARIAAAAPIRSSEATTNTGSASISAGEVLDASNPALRNTVNIAFIDATHYSVNGAGSFAYTSGGNIDVNGWRVAVTGTPAAGDTFTVANNAGGVGDNRNMLAMTQVMGQGVLSGGTESVNGAVSRFVGGIGVATNQAQAGADAQAIILKDSQSAVDSVSGVNLDEEAANMLRYQQAYQAAAQVIRITQDMFDTLIQATRR